MITEFFVELLKKKRQEFFKNTHYLLQKITFKKDVK